MYLQDDKGKWHGPRGFIQGQIEGTRFIISWTEEDEPEIKVKYGRSLSGALRRVKDLRRRYNDFQIMGNGRTEMAVFFGKFQQCVIYQIKVGVNTNGDGDATAFIKERADCDVTSDFCLNDNPEV